MLESRQEDEAEMEMRLINFGVGASSPEPWGRRKKQKIARM
jgi:hypothetical protein